LAKGNSVCLFASLFAAAHDQEIAGPAQFYQQCQEFWDNLERLAKWRIRQRSFGDGGVVRLAERLKSG